LLQYWNFEPERKDKPENPRQMDQEPAERVVKSEGSETGSHPEVSDEDKPPPAKKMPVFFLDEAHKLPALVPDEDAIKMFLDSMLYPLFENLLRQGSSRNRIDYAMLFMQLQIRSTCNGYDK
jgi:hypothetical protein